MYDRGENLENSPLILSRINALHEDCFKRLGEVEPLLERQNKFIALYESIKSRGYNEANPLWIYFDENGYLRLYDGFHRLAILNHLNIDIKVPCSIDWTGIDGTKGQDFPLVEVLKKEAPAGESLYQPIDDDRFKGWYVDRPDSAQRLEHLLSQMSGKTVLDIGCSEGYFSRELTKRGYKVTAIDWSNGLISSARYLSTINNLDIKYYTGEWYDIVQALPCFDNILMLSVIHNDAKRIGIGRALQKLWALNGKCQRLFLEVPNNDNERQWNKEGWPNWNFHNLVNIKKLEIILGMSCIRDYLGTRSIFTFTKEPSNLISIDTKRGFPVSYSKDEAFITDTLLGWHDWETQTSDYIQKNLKAGQTFVDVGANAGYFSVLASRIVGDTGKVLAFEPASDTYKVLLENTRNLNNVSAYNIALSNYTGEADFFGGKNTGQRGLNISATNGNSILEKVKVARLDSFGIHADMVKIDTEGSEADVIDGAKDGITDDTILIVENGSKIEGFKTIGQSTSWRPFNYYLKRGETPKPAYHLIGLAHTKTNKDYIMCAITQNVGKLAQMLKGNTLYHYGAEGSEVPCEHIDCISSKEQLDLYGENWKVGLFQYDRNDAVYRKFNENAIREIKKRANPQDILLCFNGNAQKPIADAVGLMTIEASIGYEGVFADKKVFESYAWMHYIYGVLNKGKAAPDGKWYDCVIPLAVDPVDFIYKEKKDNYYLYSGRVITRKGIYIAQQVTQKLGAKLIVMGPGKLEGNYPNVEHVGIVNSKERAELMAGAKALFAPTIYIEPFGAIIPESGISGTPVITTDWGAFPETVIHGKTGYRCRTFEQFLWAAQNVGQIRPIDCRIHVFKNYIVEAVKPMYEEYFQSCQDLFHNGWYTDRPERKELNWLRKY